MFGTNLTSIGFEVILPGFRFFERCALNIFNDNALSLQGKGSDKKMPVIDLRKRVTLVDNRPSTE